MFFSLEDRVRIWDEVLRKYKYGKIIAIKTWPPVTILIKLDDGTTVEVPWGKVRIPY